MLCNVLSVVLSMDSHLAWLRAAQTYQSKHKHISHRLTKAIHCSLYISQVNISVKAQSYMQRLTKAIHCLLSAHFLQGDTLGNGRTIHPAALWRRLWAWLRGAGNLIRVAVPVEQCTAAGALGIAGPALVIHVSLPAVV